MLPPQQSHCVPFLGSSVQSTIRQRLPAESIMILIIFERLLQNFFGLTCADNDDERHAVDTDKE